MVLSEVYSKILVAAFMQGRCSEGKVIAFVDSASLCVSRTSVAIDGKTLRGSRNGEHSEVHLVSAFASGARIVLGQVKTSEKSNEVTAIPELLEWLDVRGAIVSIDAMGCQKAIVQKIIHKGGDYLLGFTHKSL